MNIEALNRKWIRTKKVRWSQGFLPFWEIRRGWIPLVDKLIADCLKAGWNGELCQAKEKFGGLRFYINSAPQAVFDLIDKAGKESYTICEECGKPGVLRDKLLWILTLCDEHFSRRRKETKQ